MSKEAELYLVNVIRDSIKEELGVERRKQKLIDELEARNARLEEELKHWKHNHDNQVSRARILIERTDMPLERVTAYNLVGEMQNKLVLATNSLVRAKHDAEKYDFLYRMIDTGSLPNEILGAIARNDGNAVDNWLETMIPKG